MKMHEAEREAKEILHACGESVAFSEDSADAPTRPPGRAAAAVGCAAVALALVSWSGCFHRSTALLARDGGANYAQMCTVACAGRGGGIWGQGGSARTCAVCRLARKQARVQLLPGEGGVVQSLSGMGTVWSTVEDDEYGVSTPMSLPAGGNDDKMVDGEGMTYFPKEFSGCFDHGDHDGFRNDRRIDCVHEARRGWDDKGVHVLDADDGLSIEDLAPSEVKSRVMTYCMVRYQRETSKTQLCYEALSDAVLGTPEPVHIRLRWDDPMPHPASDYEDAKDLPVAGKPARQGGGGPSVSSIIDAYVDGLCSNSDAVGGAEASVLCGPGE